MLKTFNLLSGGAVFLGRAIFTRTAMLGLLCVSLAACEREQTVVAKSAEPGADVVKVTVSVLEAQAWSYPIESFAQLEVAETVRIGSESAGTITGVEIAEGQRVEAGQLLFTLDDKKQQLRYEQAKAASQEANTQLQQSQSTLRRQRKLRSDGAVSEDQLVQATTNYEAAVARLDQTKAALAIASAELAERSVLSPVDGVIEQEQLEVGQYVQPGESLAIIQADGALQVLAHVNEKEVLQIAVGQPATVTVAGKNYSALVESIGRSASPATGNFDVKLRLQDGESVLREGMSARVMLQVVTDTPVLVVPRSAVVDRDRKRVVFIVDEGRAVAQQVAFGLPDAESFPVISGLSSGDRLITAPLALITDGALVEIQEP